jgi:hypothetical protein
MIEVPQDESVYLALRLKQDGSRNAEMFVARILGTTCRGLPVCDIADAPPIAMEIKAARVTEILGQPTHFSFGSSELCWILNAAGFARIIAEFDKARAMQKKAAVQATAAASWPHFALSREPHYQSAGFHTGGGLLTRHLDFFLGSLQ